MNSNPAPPYNSLQAETNLLLMRLHECVGDADTVDPILTQLREVIEKAEGLGDYPVESLADVVQVFGDVFIDSNTYDELFDATVTMMERRSGEGTAGRRLLERGFQLLVSTSPIRTSSGDSSCNSSIATIPRLRTGSGSTTAQSVPGLRHSSVSISPSRIPTMARPSNWRHATVPMPNNGIRRAASHPIHRR
jgi:hypothetical protein